MLFLKGFVTISQLINNEPGIISPIGELSTWSMTYTKERGEYSLDTIPEYKLHSFKSVNESNQKTTVSDSQIQQIFEIVQYCISYATSHIRPYNPIDFKNNMLGTFYSQIENIQLGAFVDNGSLALPEFISFTSTSLDNNNIKIWLADESFQNQYDDYEIEVIPPIQNLDHFFGFYNQAVQEVTNRTLSQLISDIETVKAIHPETYLKLLEFNYFNQNNLAQSTKTTWGILVYGKAGDQIDIIKDAIVQYIISHSAYARQDWAIIFPEIFRRTEFTILPRWDKISIPNLTVSAALYTSMMNPVECVHFAMTNIDFYPQAWIEDNITLLPFDYKAISLLSINGNDNITGNQTLYDIFPDYIPVPSTSLDFNRMTIKTREWVLLMELLLITAESMTQYSTVPANLRRVTRNGIMFISALYENVNYMVAAKQNTIYQG